VTILTTDKFKKCRVSKGRVMEIFDSTGTQHKEAESCVYTSNIIKYVVGADVVPDRFDDNPNAQCSYGINVYRHKETCDEWIKAQ